MMRHPGAIKVSARMVPRGSAGAGSRGGLQFDLNPALERILEGGLASGEAAVTDGGLEKPLPAGSGIAGEAGGRSNPIVVYHRADQAIATYLRVSEALKSHGLAAGSVGGIAKQPAGSDVGSPPHAETKKSPEASLAPPKQPANTVIFIGGFGDRATTIVKDYSNEFRRKHKNLSVKYYFFDQQAEVVAYINSLGPSVPVTIVGHSWGGDTAMKIVSTLPPGRV